MGYVRRIYFTVVVISIGLLQLAYSNCSQVEFEQASGFEALQDDGADQAEGDAFGEVEIDQKKDAVLLKSHTVTFKTASLRVEQDLTARQFTIGAEESNHSMDVQLMMSGQTQLNAMNKSIDQLAPTYVPADIVITADTSGSMGDDIAELRAQLKTFIESLRADLDLRLVLAVAKRGATPSAPDADGNPVGSPMVIHATHCLSADEVISDEEIETAKTFIDNEFVATINNESPIQAGLAVYNSPPSCLRANVERFLFVMSDEDERENGHFLESSSSGHSQALSPSTIAQIQSDLSSLGVRLYAGVDVDGTLPPNGAAHEGTNIKSLVAFSGGQSYNLGAGLADNLANFSQDLLEIVQNYNLSNSPIKLIRGRIGNDELTQGTDFTLSNVGNAVKLSEAITNRIGSGEIAQFAFFTEEQTNIALPNGRVSLVSSQIEDASCWSRTDDFADISACLELSDLDQAVSIDLYVMPDQISLTNSGVSSRDEIVAVSFNGEVIANPVVSDQLLLDTSSWSFGLNNQISVTSRTLGNRISGISQVHIDSISVNGTPIDPTCVNWSGDVFDLSGCNLGVVQSIVFNGIEGDRTSYSMVQPADEVVSALVFGVDVSQFNVRFEAGRIFFDNVSVDLPEEISVSYLARDSLSISLESRPADDQSVRVMRGGSALPANMFQVRRIEPFAVILNDELSLFDGEELEVWVD